MFESINIKDFSDAWFFEKYDKISKENFDIAYTEYVDCTGLSFTAEFDLVCYIHYLNTKINSVKLAVSLHKQFVEEFGSPFEGAFVVLKKNGYKVVWNNSKNDFFGQLDKIIKKLSKFEVELNGKKKQLEVERAKYKNGDQPDIKKSRVEFIKMVNTLNKIGFKIDKTETTVEELALMLKQQLEEQESYKNKNAYA